jgi:hypothetical protein
MTGNKSASIIPIVIQRYASQMRAVAEGQKSLPIAKLRSGLIALRIDEILKHYGLGDRDLPFRSMATQD